MKSLHTTTSKCEQYVFCNSNPSTLNTLSQRGEDREDGQLDQNYMQLD